MKVKYLTFTTELISHNVVDNNILIQLIITLSNINNNVINCEHIS